MDRDAFNELVGCKLSVALTKIKENGVPESYIGYLDKVGSDYIILDYDKATTNRNNSIDKVILTLSEIIGVWIYK